MDQVTRRHHFNPRFMLAGFTESGKKGDSLWCFDAEFSKAIRRAPKAVAWELDYYAVDVPGEPPDAVEKAFGEIESLAAPVIRKTIQNEKLPEGEDWIIFLTFLALMYVRDQGWRETATSVPEQFAEISLRAALSSPEMWEATQAAMTREGFESGTYEEMIEIVSRHGFDFRIANPSAVHVQQIAYALRDLPPIFAQRNWSLLVAEPSAGDFVSADNPAFIVWTVPGLAELSPAGLGYRDTEVTFALHRRIALVGSLEDRPERIAANRDLVAAINGRTARFAIRFVYGPTRDFVWGDHDGRQLGAADWFAWRASLASNE